MGGLEVKPLSPPEKKPLSLSYHMNTLRKLHVVTYQIFATAGDNPKTYHKKKKKENKGGKRGNPGVFLGKHQVFLEQHTAEYLKQKTRPAKTLWLTGFRKTWFNMFPWHLDEQPAEFTGLNDEPTVESAGGEPVVSTTLSEEERKELMKREKLEKDKVQAAGISQLAGWFHRLGSKGKSTEGGGGGDAFKGIKQQMLKARSESDTHVEDPASGFQTLCGFLQTTFNLNPFACMGRTTLEHCSAGREEEVRERRKEKEVAGECVRWLGMPDSTGRRSLGTSDAGVWSGWAHEERVKVMKVTVPDPAIAPIASPMTISSAL
ncbi:hypothetical protein BT96DRAFT_998792 [Gymnopus androsaceus JB14]|uniref:Uncharacterized protein n=1 Tax=Gymnopus androsaceus JB14 TaxID=1447944 RepID=A0A6A4H925_9AGAR|nr:hypothetical protein BT96DRAFT_998792 [Gymnopus androsaceus JB14]